MIRYIAKDRQVSMQQLPGCQAQDITRHYFRILGPTHHSSYLRYQRLSTEWGRYVLTRTTLGCFCLVTPYIKYKLSTWQWISILWEQLDAYGPNVFHKATRISLHYNCIKCSKFKPDASSIKGTFADGGKETDFGLKQKGRNRQMHVNRWEQLRLQCSSVLEISNRSRG